MFKLYEYISDRARRVVESRKTNPNNSKKNILKKVGLKDLFDKREIIPCTIKLAIYTCIVRLEILEDNKILSH